MSQSLSTLRKFFSIHEHMKHNPEAHLFIIVMIEQSELSLFWGVGSHPSHSAFFFLSQCHDALLRRMVYKDRAEMLITKPMFSDQIPPALSPLFHSLLVPPPPCVCPATRQTARSLGKSSKAIHPKHGGSDDAQETKLALKSALCSCNASCHLQLLSRARHPS